MAKNIDTIIKENVNGFLMQESLTMLFEGADMWEVYDKYYSDKISRGIYRELVELDPTSKNGQKGKYLPWLVSRYIKNTQPTQRLSQFLQNLVKEYGGRIDGNIWITPIKKNGIFDSSNRTLEDEIHERIYKAKFSIGRFGSIDGYEAYTIQEGIDLQNTLGAIEIALKWYDENKNYLPQEYIQYKDINKMSFEDLEKLYTSLEGAILNPNVLKKQINVIYDDDEWIVYNPLSYEAERYIVWHIYDGTSWCTAVGENGDSSGRDMFEKYTKNDGRLFIFARKKDNALFQLSDYFNEFRNSENDEFDLDEIDLSENVINFFQDKMGIDLIGIIGDRHKEEFEEESMDVGDSGMKFWEGHFWWDYQDMASPEGTDYEDFKVHGDHVIIAFYYNNSGVIDIYVNQDDMTSENEGWHLKYEGAEVVSTGMERSGYYIQFNNYFGFFDNDEGWFDCVEKVKSAEEVDKNYNPDSLWVVKKEDGTQTLYSAYLGEYEYEITHEDLEKNGLGYFGELVQHGETEGWVIDYGQGYIKTAKSNFYAIKKMLRALNYINVSVTEDESDNNYLIIKEKGENEKPQDYSAFAKEVGERLGLQYGVEENGTPYLLVPKALHPQERKSLHNFIKDELGINYKMMADYDEQTYKIDIRPRKEYEMLESIKRCLNEYLQKEVLNESLNNFDAPLYHNTSMENLLTMMELNSIRSNYHRGYNVEETHNGICFTRSKTYNPYIHYDVRMTFDTEKLLRATRGLKLVSYQDGLWSGLDEFEERLISKNGDLFVVNNLSDIVTEVVIILDRTCREIIESGADIDDYLNDLKKIVINNIFGDRLKIVDNLKSMNEMSFDKAYAYVENECADDEYYNAYQVYCVEYYDVSDETWTYVEYSQNRNEAIESAKQMYEDDGIPTRVIYGEYDGQDYEKKSIVQQFGEFDEGCNTKIVKEARQSQYSIWREKFEKYVQMAVKKIDKMPFCQKFGISAYRNDGMDEDECYGMMDDFAALDYEITEASFEEGENTIAFYCNPKLLFKSMKRLGVHDDDLEIQAQAFVTVGHEVGHGLILFLQSNEELKMWIEENIDDMPNVHDVLYQDDEEQIAEEFGESTCSRITRVSRSKLGDALNEILSLM